MSPLIIEGTKSTPSINLDSETNVLMIKGQSYPENAFKFYESIFTWVDTYLASNHSEVHIEIGLSYINTSSSKCIMMLLEKFEEAYQRGLNLKLNWYCDLENESEVECAEEFQEDITFPFVILEEVKH
jgi:hypothetical protein